MKLQETLKRIKRIRRDITDERDISCGNMGFTMYKNDDGSARLCENATYYTYDDDGDMADTYDIEL